MKPIIMNTKMLCLFLLLLLSIHVPSFAAFPVSKAASVAPSHPVSAFFQRFGIHAAPEKKRSVNGSLSLAFGIAALVTFIWGGGIYFGIPALVLGVAGMRNKERYARTGKIMGLAALIATGVVIVVFVVGLSILLMGGGF